jgi:NADP-dependent 3-hydroxy acid dehydrogenase YdfG
MNKIVLITGASSGFGEACARKFAAAGGYDIIITGRRKDRLDSLQREITASTGSTGASTTSITRTGTTSGTSSTSGTGSTGSLSSSPATRVLSVVFDVQDREAVFTAIGSLPADWKGIDILVNNAGLALGRDFFEEADMQDWETMLDTNVKGLLYVSRAVLPGMTARKQGHIINMGSVAGKEIYEKGNAYCASKFAVDAISKSMRVDLLRHHIKVTAIHPGAAETEFSLVRFKGDETAAKKIYDGFKPLSAEDIADAVYYCASLPPHVCINDLVITCTAQADAIYFHKQ